MVAPAHCWIFGNLTVTPCASLGRNARVTGPATEVPAHHPGPDETRTVQIPLKAQALAYWDAGKKSWVVEPDRVKLMVGSSSADVKLEKTIDIAQ